MAIKAVMTPESAQHHGGCEVARPAGFVCRWSSGAPAFHAGGDEGEMRTEEAVSRPLWAPRAGSPGQPSQRGDKPAYRRAPWNTHFRGANGLTEVARLAGFACRWSSGAPAFMPGGGVLDGLATRYPRDFLGSSTRVGCSG